MKVKKAVILAAGMGTRMLPSSKVIPKEILPVVDTPAIQVVVEEAVASGIEEIVIVVSPGKTTVVEHFNSNAELERHLEERGKNEILEIVRRSIIRQRSASRNRRSRSDWGMRCCRRERRWATRRLR